jgi:hypothetical protein
MLGTYRLQHLHRAICPLRDTFAHHKDTPRFRQTCTNIKAAVVQHNRHFLTAQVRADAQRKFAWIFNNFIANIAALLWHSP